MKLDFQPAFLTESVEKDAFLGYWLRRIFIDDWLMKIVALVVTIALWLGVTGLRTPTTRNINNVSLSPLVATNYEITNTMTPEIDIEITGDKDKVNQIDPRQLSARVDLTSLKEGDQTIQLTPKSVSVELPNGVTVVRLTPDKIAVRLERVEIKEVPVKIEFTGEVGDGFEVYSKTANPAKVNVRGPRSFIDSLSFVSTGKVDLADRENSFSTKVALQVSDPKISFVGDVTTMVNVEVGLIRSESIVTVPYESEERSRRAIVTLFGPRVTLEKLRTEDIVIAEQPDNEGNSILSAVLPDYASGILVKSVRRAGKQ